MTCLLACLCSWVDIYLTTQILSQETIVIDAFYPDDDDDDDALATVGRSVSNPLPHPQSTSAAAPRAPSGAVSAPGLAPGAGLVLGTGPLVSSASSAVLGTSPAVVGTASAPVSPRAPRASLGAVGAPAMPAAALTSSAPARASEIYGRVFVIMNSFCRSGIFPCRR